MVTLRWRDSVLIIEGLAEDTYLTKKLSYWKAETQIKGYKRIYVPQLKEMFWKQDGYLLTMPGFLFKVRGILREFGIEPIIFDERTPSPKPNVEAAMDGLWPAQQPIVYTMLMSGGGILSGPTGIGKTAMAAALIRAYSHEELTLRGTSLSVFACPERDINVKNYHSLKKFLPHRDVGILQSGHKKIITDDVMVITYDSLQNIDLTQVGVFIGDEVHAGVSESRAEQIQKIEHAIKFGVSATPGGRYDGRDPVIEGLFGPVVFRKTYQEAVADGILVPIKVIWVEAPSPEIGMVRYLGMKTREGKIGQGIIRNNAYNKMLADIMMGIPEDKQTIAITPTIEHISRVRRYYPDMAVVHAETAQASLISRGFENVPAVSTKDRKKIYDRVNSGDIRKIMCTYVYKQGVDFPGLEIMINAGGGGSEIAAKQIPGRASRKSKDKDAAVLIDFWHPWDRKTLENGKQTDGPLLGDDKKRRKFYGELGFEQVWVKGAGEVFPLLAQGEGKADETKI